MDRVLLLFVMVILFTIVIVSCGVDEYSRMEWKRVKIKQKVKMKRMQDELNRSEMYIKEVRFVESDYEIDLKPNYIIVYSQNGNVDTIPYAIDHDCVSPIEAFFERDNM